MAKYRNGTALHPLSILVSPTMPTVISDTYQSRIDSGHQETITSSTQSFPAEKHESHCPQESKAGRTVLMGCPAIGHYSPYLAATTEARDSSVELKWVERPPSAESFESHYPQDSDGREKARPNNAITERTPHKVFVEFKDNDVDPEQACIEHCEFNKAPLAEASNGDRDLRAAKVGGHHINDEQREAEEDFYADERSILLEIDTNRFYYDEEEGVLKILSTTPETTVSSELLLGSMNKQPGSGDSTPTYSAPVAIQPRVEEIRAAVRIPEIPVGPFVTSASDLNAIFPPTPEALSTWEYPAYIRRARRALPESWETPNKDEPFVYPPGKPAPHLDPALRGTKKNEYDLYGEYYGYCGYGAYTGYMFRPDSNCGDDSEEEEDGVLGAADVYRKGDLFSSDASPLPPLPPPKIETSNTDHNCAPDRIEPCFSDSTFAQPPVEPTLPILSESHVLEWLEGVSAPQLDRLQLHETEGKCDEVSKTEEGVQEGRRQEGRQDGTRGKIEEVRVQKTHITVDQEHWTEEEENELTCQGCQDRTNNMCLYCNRCHASCCIHQVTLEMLEEATRVRLAAEKSEQMAKMKGATEVRNNVSQGSLPKHIQNEQQWVREGSTGAKPNLAWYNCPF